MDENNLPWYMALFSEDLIKEEKERLSKKLQKQAVCGSCKHIESCEIDVETAINIGCRQYEEGEKKMDEALLNLIAGALDLIHKQILMRNAYDVGLITKEHYQDYLKTMLYIPNPEKKYERSDKVWYK